MIAKKNIKIIFYFIINKYLNNTRLYKKKKIYINFLNMYKINSERLFSFCLFNRMEIIN